MRYTKGGLIWKPDGSRSWARGYATIPTPLLLGDVIRVYFASLDESLFGRIGYLEVDASDPSRVTYEHPDPVLDLGPLGSFDDSGVNASCVLPDEAGGLRLYYIGWQRCERVPYMLFTGLATSAGSSQFERTRRVPVLDRTDSEPFSRSAPFVLRERDAWRMWYWSCEEWTVDHGTVHYNNVIRHATSTDGVAWTGGEIVLRPEGEEYAVGRPWVVRDGAVYRMWFSARSFSLRYTIGYAESSDGLHWIRRSGDVLPRSEAGWDSEMVCYPAVIDTPAGRLLFYNGNRHGQSGFGYAMIEAEIPA
ncbi:MAG TPA: hypothetical protein VF701_05610 [Thermoanaerobaculia bacterium]